ncbi:hypothetical protein Tco_1455095 [Tanacetum coccineum]
MFPGRLSPMRLCWKIDTVGRLEFELKALPNKLEEIQSSISALTNKVAFLEDFRLEIPARLLALTGQVSSINAQLTKLKVLDALLSPLDKFVVAMDKFAKAIKSTSYKAGDHSVPLAGQACTHSAKGEKNIKQATIT